MESYGVMSLTKVNKQGALQVAIPAVLSRALTERGYNKAECFLTEEGLLFKPFKGDKSRRRIDTAELPEWDTP